MSTGKDHRKTSLKGKNFGVWDREKKGGELPTRHQKEGRLGYRQREARQVQAEIAR